jgi:hypothetical protein
MVHHQKRRTRLPQVESHSDSDRPSDFSNPFGELSFEVSSDDDASAVSGTPDLDPLSSLRAACSGAGYPSLLAAALDEAKSYAFPGDTRMKIHKSSARRELDELCRTYHGLGVFQKCRTDILSGVGDGACNLSLSVMQVEFEKLRKMQSLKTRDASGTSFSVSDIYQEMSDSSHNIVRILDTFLCTSKEKPEPNKKIRVVMALASLVHSRNDHTNHVQSLIGLYLYSLNTPKRAIMSLNQLGICVSYSTISRNLEAAADVARRGLRQIGPSGHAFIPVFDNLTFMAKVRDTRLDNQAEYNTWSTGFVLIPPASRRPQAFSQLTDVDRDKISELGIRIFLPSGEDHQNMKAACEAIICEILDGFCKFEGVTLKDKLSYELPTVFRIDPQEPPEVYPLRTYDLNEAYSSDMIQILYSIQEDTGLTKEQCLENMYLFSGDLMTVEGIRYVAHLSSAKLDKHDFGNQNVRITKGCGTLRWRPECSIYSWPPLHCFTRPTSGITTRSAHSPHG